VGVYITDPNEPGTTLLPPGLYGRHIHATVEANRVARLRMNVYKYAANTLETQLGSNESVDFTDETSSRLLDWTFTTGTGAVLELTDRLVFKLYAARVSGGSSADVTVYFEGADRASYLSTSILNASVGDAFARAQANAAFNKANGAAQNAFVTISVSGESDVVADSNTDTLTFVEGPGIVFTTVPSNDSIIVTSTAYGNNGDRVFYENYQNVTANYSITFGSSAMSTGPITINPGVFVTIPGGSRWVVI
jgi:hypothetical protein